MLIKANRHRAFIKILLSYIVILVIPLILGVIAYRETLRTVEKEARNNNILALEQCDSLLSARLMETEAIVTQLSLSSKVKNMLIMDSPYDQGAAIFRINEMQEEIAPYRVTNSFIRCLYLYFRNSNVIISPQESYINMTFFYENFFKFGSMDYSDWRSKIFDRNHQREYLSSVPVSLKGKTENMITYLQSISIDNYNKTEGVIMALLPESEIHKYLGKLNLGETGWAYIADEKGQILTTFASDKKKVQYVSLDYSRDRGFLDKDISGERMIVSYMISPFNGWKYVAVFPYSLVMQRVNYIKQIIWVVMMLSLTLGIIVAYLMAYYNFKPIKEIINIMKDKARNQEDDEKQYNEYDFLNNSINKLITNNSDLAKNIEAQRAVMKTTFFSYLLNGNFNNESEIEVYSSLTGIENMNGSYCVFVTRINTIEEKVSETAVKEMNTAKIVAKQIIERFEERNIFIYDIDFNVFATLIFHRNSDSEDFTCGMEKVIKEICEILQHQYYINVRIGAGRIVDNAVNINHCFEEAKLAMDYERNNQDTAVMWYQDIPKDREFYYYPLEIENKIINCVKSGDKDSLIQSMEYLYSENSKLSQADLDMTRFFISNVTCTAVKLIDQVGISDKIIRERFKKQVRGAGYGTMEEKYAMVTKTLLELCKIVEEKKKSHKTELKDKILEYINSNYMDTELCLCSVANVFNISEGYLSQFFKEQAGENFCNYLEKLRVHQACKLLREDSLSISDIAKLVGYNSPHVFRSAFKRVEGVSPTSYKTKGLVES